MKIFFSKFLEANPYFFLIKIGLDGGKVIFGLDHHLGQFFLKGQGAEITL
jgi:hypothetical protein